MKIFVQLLFLLPLTCSGQLIGKVISIADGDTFTLQTKNEKIKIRLHGIDCPEINQDYGDVAKKYLIVQISFHGDSVTVQKTDVDRYGRTVGIAYSGKTNINESLLEHGLAWHYKRYDQNPMWDQLEKGARLARFNLWSNENAIPPWEFRKSKNR